MNVEQIFREFLQGRRAFADLEKTLKSVEASVPQGRAIINDHLNELIGLGLFPNDLALALRASLDRARPAASDDDIFDPPTEPMGAAGARPPAGGGAEIAGVDPLRDKVDEVVLSALTENFRGLKQRGGEARADRQLDLALQDFRGARLRRDATKAADGAARAFDFSSLTKSADQPLRVGSILKNRFVLDREIGRGGMGVVYRAVDRRRLEAMHQQPYVAIKLLTGSIGRSPDALRVLEAEARRAQALAHPNIVTIYDFDRDGSNVFIVMELLQGAPLDALLSEAPGGVGYNAARTVVEALCKGLGYAHAAGVIHCDLKPANVFISETGGVKILDFGIATAAWSSGFDLSQLNAYTVAYASPQMLRGEDRDARDDVYALGCLVYALLTGKHPFDRVSALEASEAKLKPLRPAGAPKPAWRALQRALAFDRARRPKDAEAFRQDYFQRGGLGWLFGGTG